MITLTPELLRQNREVLRNLACGIDPETGDRLPACEVLDEPMVIRALLIASDLLTKELAIRSKMGANRTSSRSPGRRAGEAWSPTEDRDLCRAIQTQTDILAIARKHGRTRAAIEARLVRLGLADSRAQARRAHSAT